MRGGRGEGTERREGARDKRGGGTEKGERFRGQKVTPPLQRNNTPLMVLSQSLSV